MRTGLIMALFLVGCTTSENECVLDARNSIDNATSDVCVPQEGSSADCPCLCPGSVVPISHSTPFCDDEDYTAAMDRCMSECLKKCPSTDVLVPDDSTPNDADADLPPTQDNGPDGADPGGEIAACEDLPKPSIGACINTAESILPHLSNSMELVVVGIVDEVVDGTQVGGCMQTQRFVVGTTSHDNPADYTILLTDDDGVQWALEVSLPNTLPPPIDTRVRVEVALQVFDFSPSFGFIDLSTEDGERMWWIGEAGTVSTLQPPAAMRFRQDTKACADSFEHCGSWAGYDVMVERVFGSTKVPYGETVQVGTESVINGGVELQTTTVTTCPDWYHAIAIMAVLWPDSLDHPSE